MVMYAQTTFNTEDGVRPSSRKDTSMSASLNIRLCMYVDVRAAFEFHQNLELTLERESKIELVWADWRLLVALIATTLANATSSLKAG